MENMESKSNLWDFETIVFPFKAISFFIKRMFNLSGHETLRIGFKSSQAGLCTKKDPLTAENGTGITLRVFDLTTAGGNWINLLRSWF